MTSNSISKYTMLEMRIYIQTKTQIKPGGADTHFYPSTLFSLLQVLCPHVYWLIHRHVLLARFCVRENMNFLFFLRLCDLT